MQNGWAELRIAAIECNYKEIHRQLKQQFIHRLEDNNMMVEINKVLTASEKIIYQVLL